MPTLESLEKKKFDKTIVAIFSFIRNKITRVIDNLLPGYQVSSSERQKVISFRLCRIVFNQATNCKLPSRIRCIIVFGVQVKEYRVTTRIVPSNRDVLNKSNQSHIIND